MKKVLLSVIICTSLCPFVYGQNISVVNNDRPIAVSIIPNAGVNLSYFSGDGQSTHFSMRVGANAGVSVGLRFIKRNSHTPVEDGLLGLYAGASFEMGGVKEETNGGIQMLNLGIPVFLQIYPVKNFYIEAGPEFFLNLSNTPNQTVFGNMQLKGIAQHKANDIKIAVGAGFKIGNFGIGARYLMGITPFASNVPWKCNIIQLNLFYSFQLSTGSRPNRIVM